MSGVTRPQMSLFREISPSLSPAQTIFSCSRIISASPSAAAQAFLAMVDVSAQPPNSAHLLPTEEVIERHLNQVFKVSYCRYRRMYAKINLQTLSCWWLTESVSRKSPTMQRFLKEVGASSFQESRKFGGLLSGWVEVPQGSCITLILSA